jgi:predicted nucleic acid-binding protein
MSEAIFLDASFWIRFRNPKDNKTGMARAIVGKLARSQPIFVTTLLVAAETHAFFARNSNLRARILQDIENSALLRFETVRHEDEKEAVRLLRDRTDKSYSLCDAISFTIMKRLKISRALSFDSHFAQTGLFHIIDHPDLV